MPRPKNQRMRLNVNFIYVIIMSRGKNFMMVEYCGVESQQTANIRPEQSEVVSTVRGMETELSARGFRA